MVSAYLCFHFPVGPALRVVLRSLIQPLGGEEYIRDDRDLIFHVFLCDKPNRDRVSIWRQPRSVNNHLAIDNAPFNYAAQT